MHTHIHTHIKPITHTHYANPRSILVCWVLETQFFSHIESCKTHNTLQRTTATHCNTLQHTATHCNTLWPNHLIILSHVRHRFQISASVLHCVVALRIDSTSSPCRMCCSVLQCVAVVRCSVFPCVIVCNDGNISEVYICVWYVFIATTIISNNKTCCKQ